MMHRNQSKKKSRIVRGTILLLLAWFAVVGWYQTHKSLPDNLNFRSEQYSIASPRIRFLYDLTSSSDKGEKHHEQSIFEAIFTAIDEAERYILIDMFLFNAYRAKNDTVFIDLSKELTSRLVEKKLGTPDIAIDFITDPINTVYGGSDSPELGLLRQTGINVIVTDLTRLRDSNFLYSAIWRSLFQWFGNSMDNGWFKHPFSSDDTKVTLRSYLDLLNFKANHRKVLLADSSGDMVTIIGSANPHGGSSEHSNIAFLIRGNVWRSVYDMESAVAALSGSNLSHVGGLGKSAPSSGDTRVRVLSEKQIKRAIIDQLAMSGSADRIRIAQFYLADRDVIEALLDASARGSAIQIILDPNKDAFGYRKNGIPNRQTGTELAKRSSGSIEVRWYETHGEQFHAKLFVSEKKELITVILGSANLTRRNLDNFNLELDVEVVLEKKSESAREVIGYFDAIWTNQGGNYTVDLEVYQDDSFLRKAIYRVQERLGLCTF